MFQIASLNTILTDYAEIMFSKLRSAGLKHHLLTLSFFTDAYCAGFFNKHCLLTFFIDAVTSCSIFDKFIFSEKIF